MPKILYKKEEEKDFDEMVKTLKAMPEHEQQKLQQVFRGILIGVQLGKKENEPVA